MPRLLLCVLLLMVLAFFQSPGKSQNQQPPDNANARTRWEYKVFNAEANNCALESYLTGALNRLGQDGWELVSYQRLSPAFPSEARGDLLIKPAATGPGAAVQPVNADSFEGAIDMKMAPVQPGGCQMLLKREWLPPAR